MDITILTSSQNHPIYAHLQEWKELNSASHKIEIKLSPNDISGGDFLFLISCSDIVTKAVRDKYKHCLVVHASDLPAGRGWSPHIWQIIEGKNNITVSLLEAKDKVDSGDIWLQEIMQLEGHELYNEINKKLFDITLSLMSAAINNHDKITPKKQQSDNASYYPKRTPSDSKIDITLPLDKQFDLLRVADAERFPAFFEFRGHKYKIKIEKDD